MYQNVGIIRLRGIQVTHDVLLEFFKRHGQRLESVALIYVGFASDSLSTWDDLVTCTQPFLGLDGRLHCKIVGGRAMEQRLIVDF